MTDPVADFLAREQDMFADLESPGDGQQQQPIFNADDADFDGFSSPPVANGEGGNRIIVDNHDLFNNPPDFNADVPAVDSGVDLQGLVPTNLGTPTLSLRSNASGTSLDSSTMMSAGAFGRQGEEPETLKKWREKNEKAIEEKDRNEAAKKEEWKANGKKELDNWYAEREARLKAVRQANREHEAALVKDNSSPSNPESPDWQRIVSLCDMSYKSSKDLSRMRELITSM
uniref:Clathrin light chain n=1 Tax=Parastrongyloides trichosuri TaxID=131310 RepID=A0A0N4ZDK4_PARTI